MKSYTENYQEKLDKFREFIKENLTGNAKNSIDVFQSQVDSVLNFLSERVDVNGDNLKEVLIRTLSKDLSRYYDNFEKYQLALAEMKSSNLLELRKKIVFGDKDFFSSVWKEDSDNFFRTRKFFSTYLKDKSLVHKLNSLLDSIVVGLYRYTLNKYSPK